MGFASKAMATLYFLYRLLRLLLLGRVFLGLNSADLVGLPGLDVSEVGMRALIKQASAVLVLKDRRAIQGFGDDGFRLTFLTGVRVGGLLLAESGAVTDTLQLHVWFLKR